MTVEATARMAQAAMEPLVAMIYFVPEGPAHYKPLGMRAMQGYFCTRSAAMGVVPGEVVAATFYNFNPAYVVPQVNEGWQKTTPQAAAEARNAAVSEALTRLLAEEDGSLPDVKKALNQLRKATEGLSNQGRPLFAAHQAQPWPEGSDLLQLWWGANLLREYRGDGHIAALLTHEVSGLESIFLAAAWSSRVNLQGLLLTRAWSEEQVAQAKETLLERDLVKDGALTEKGKALRDSIEDLTDRLAVAPWQKLGDETEDFIGFAKTLSRRIVERGGLTIAPRK